MKKDNKDIYSTNIKWFEKTYMNLVESRKYRGTKKKKEVMDLINITFFRNVLEERMKIVTMFY